MALGALIEALPNDQRTYACATLKARATAADKANADFDAFSIEAEAMHQVHLTFRGILKRAVSGDSQPVLIQPTEHTHIERAAHR